MTHLGFGFALLQPVWNTEALFICRSFLWEGGVGARGGRLPACVVLALLEGE